MLLLSTTAEAGPKLDTSDPLGFFTNLSSRFLQSELNLNLTRIQVWPANQYTPAVHRLLQVTANILDATTNRFNDSYPFLPSVFRPVFQREGTSLFIVGYRSVEQVNPPGDPVLVAPIDPGNPAELNSLPEGVVLPINVYGVPWVIGAKKGFPNFNEFSMQSVFQITRRLQVTRTNSTPSLNHPSWQTNMLYIVGISNVVVLEAWNSYRSNYNRAVDLYVGDDLSMTLTNHLGYGRTTNVSLPRLLSIPPQQWWGYNPFSVPTNNFQVPLRENVVFQYDVAYEFSTRQFTTNWDTAWDRSQSFELPQWQWLVANKLRFIMLDPGSGRVIDYVQLDGPNTVCDLSAEIQKPLEGKPPEFADLWSTNRLGSGLPIGINNQLLVSLGNASGATENWSDYGIGNPTGPNKEFAIDYFRAMYGLSPLFPARWPDGLVNTNLIQQVPFSPTARVVQYVTWQANDPLVHYMLDDLQNLALANGVERPSAKEHVDTHRNIGAVNDRYQPWGGNPTQVPGQPNPYALALKDSLIRSSDHWSFLESEPLSFALLGRVHRGTPWQTVYLKSAGVELAAWTNWTGNANSEETARTMPTNDWQLAGLVVSLLNTNNPRQLLSVNERNSNAWLVVQNGMTGLTNSLTDTQLNSFGAVAQFDTITVSSNSLQAATVAEAIAQARATRPHQHFRRLGDILATPELSVASPWLNLSTATQLRRGISDEAYEKIPTQLLPLLRADSVGSLIQTGAVSHIEFTGYDDYPYAVQVSSNLVDWVSVSTNYPTNGVFEFVETSPPVPAPRFYRCALLP